MSDFSKNSLFLELNNEELGLLKDSMETIKLEKGSEFIHEGDKEDCFYFIAKGKVNVFKKSEHTVHILNQLNAGDCVDVMVLVDKLPRSASAVCETDCVLYKFDTHQLNQSIIDKICNPISQKLAAGLRNTNTVAADALKDKFLKSAFFVKLLVSITIYTLFLNFTEKINNYLSSSKWLSLAIIIGFTLVIIPMMKNSGHPYSYYGVKFDNFWKNVKESIYFTIPILIMLVIIKWLIIFFVPAFHDFKLFDSGAFFNTEQLFTYQKYFLFMFFYVLLCPVQEFLVRGFIQTSMQALMDGHSGWGLVKVILLSNLVFASMHAHISFFFEISAFIPGLFWGWLYARQKTLVGVSVSHILIGVWAVFIVGFQNMI